MEGWTPEPGQELQVDLRGATPGYFSTMRIPLIAGRYFDDADLGQGAAPVAIIDRKFAQRFWPRGNAIGKHLWFGPDPTKNSLTIVGVVGTVKQYGLDVDGRIVFYTPSANAAYQVARTSGDPATVAGAMVKRQRYGHEPGPLVGNRRADRSPVVTKLSTATLVTVPRPSKLSVSATNQPWSAAWSGDWE